MTYIDIVFQGSPAEPTTFVEIENPTGQSIRVGEWLQRPDGYWVLRIPSPVAPSSSDDSVIEEAFKAHEGAPTWQDDPEGRDAAIRWHMRGFTDALTAHAPTDEEREALAVIVKRIAQMFGGPSMAEFANDPPIRKHYATADAILAEGFRRSEVPEPQGELSATDTVDGVLRLGPKTIQALQGGEPSDAQVIAALNAYATTPQQHGKGREDAMRAALRAAGSLSATLDTVPEQRPGGHHD